VLWIQPPRDAPPNDDGVRFGRATAQLELPMEAGSMIGETTLRHAESRQASGQRFGPLSLPSSPEVLRHGATEGRNLPDSRFVFRYAGPALGAVISRLHQAEVLLRVRSPT
jgi:hypothetical protein